MTELEGLIRFWDATLKAAWFLLEPSATYAIEKTIKILKELQAKEEGT